MGYIIKRLPAKRIRPHTKQVKLCWRSDHCILAFGKKTAPLWFSSTSIGKYMLQLGILSGFTKDISKPDLAVIKRDSVKVSLTAHIVLQVWYDFWHCVHVCPGGDVIAAVMVAACADSWLATELFLNWGGTTVPCIYCQLYIVWPHSYK